MGARAEETPTGPAPSAAERFFEAYAIADEATISRARGCAAMKSLGLISVGNAGDKGLPGGKPTWGPAGRRTLTRLLAG